VTAFGSFKITARMGRKMKWRAFDHSKPLWQQQIYTLDVWTQVQHIHLSVTYSCHWCQWFYHSPDVVWSTFAFPSCFSSRALCRRWVCSSDVVSATLNVPSWTLHNSADCQRSWSAETAEHCPATNDTRWQTFVTRTPL